MINCPLGGDAFINSLHKIVIKLIYKFAINIIMLGGDAIINIGYIKLL